jgi:hypothetical protein
MADTEKPTKNDLEKAPVARANSPVDPEKPAAGRKTKLVAETGRYVCKEPLVFMTPDGRRATAKAGEVVAIHESDARPLMKRRIVESEEETAEG